MTTLEILRGARELLSDRKRWTRDELARDKHSHPVYDPLNFRACRFCAVGAIIRAAGVDLPSRAAPFQRLESVIPTLSIGTFNDSARHADVLAAFDRAIAAEEARA